MACDLRAELPGDEAPIRALTRAAFAAAENASGTEWMIVDALRAHALLAVSLVAIEDEAIVGHAAISPVVLIPNEGGPEACADAAVEGWFGLGPISVSPQRQGRGIGTELIQRALGEIEAEQGCVVLGDPSYYARFDFHPDPRLVLLGVSPELFQVRILAARRIPRATVRYADAFDVDGRDSGTRRSRPARRFEAGTRSPSATA